MLEKLQKLVDFADQRIQEEVEYDPENVAIIRYWVGYKDGVLRALEKAKENND